MHLSGPDLLLSATDLSNFLSCRQLTALSMAVIHGKPKPPEYNDPLRDILFQRGTDHEKRYVELLRSKGRQIVDLTEVDKDARVARTMEAMRSGADVIVQGALRDGRW